MQQNFFLSNDMVTLGFHEVFPSNYLVTLQQKERKTGTEDSNGRKDVFEAESEHKKPSPL